MSILIMLGVLLWGFSADSARAAERLLGVQSARVMSQSMPWIAEETGIFRKYNLEFQAYNAEIKALEPRMELRLEAIQAILDDVGQIDPRAKKFKPQDFYDRRYLDELEKSGFLDKLWGGSSPR